MNIESFVNPTYYKIKSALIKSQYANIEGIDITALITKIVLNSSIDSATMSGVIRIIDSVGLLENTPLRGEEQIKLELLDSKIINENGGIDMEIENPYTFIGFIYKIDNVATKEVNDALVYDMHFISYQSFMASTYELIRPFRDKSVSEIVKILFDEYYLNEDFISNLDEVHRKEIIIEETDGMIKCIIPRMRTDAAMNFLSKRAYSSSDSPSCTFRFFESSRGYHFITDERIFSLAEEDESRKFTFTYLDAIPNRLEYFEQQLNNLEIIENTERLNTLKDIYQGSYMNKVYELDIVSRKLNLLDNTGQYDYLSERRKYFDVKNNENIVDRHTESFIRDIHRETENIQKKFLVVVTYAKEVTESTDSALPVETHYAEIISNRQAYSNHIESITIKAIGSGRLDITAGDVIELDVNKFQFANSENTPPEKNKHLSGFYIVRSVTHIMDKEEMKNTYTLIKKDWSQTEEVYDDAILRNQRRGLT
jgi:hypothetical protein